MCVCVRVCVCVCVCVCTTCVSACVSVCCLRLVCVWSIWDMGVLGWMLNVCIVVVAGLLVSLPPNEYINL